MDYCTIYADPPYPTSGTRAYSVRGFDRDGLADLLMGNRARWEYPATATRGIYWAGAGLRDRHCAARLAGGGRQERPEVLWLNDKASATRPGLFGESPANDPAK